MKKILISIFLIFILAIAGLYFYINQIFIPHKLKGILTTKLQESIGRTITYDSIDYHFPKGIDIHNLTILEKDSTETFLKINKISFNVLLTGIIETQSIVIPSLEIINPKVRLTKQTQSIWNFSDLIKTESTTSTSSSPFKFLIRKIIINNGEIDLIDQSSPEKFQESLSNIHIQAVLNLNKTADFSLSAQMKEKSSSITLNGKINIDHKSLQSNVSLKNIALVKYLKPFVTLPTISFNSGVIETADLNLNYSPEQIKAQGSFILQKASLSGTGSVDQPNASFKEIKGDLNIDSFSFNKTPSQIQLEASIRLNSALIKLINDQSLEGNITAVFSNLIISPESTTLKGKLKIDQSRLTLDAAKHMAGQLMLNNIILEKKASAISIKADAQLQNGHIELSPTQIIDGNIALFRTEVNVTDKISTLQTDLELKNVVIKTSDKTSIQGTLTAPKFAASLNDSLLSLSGNIQLDVGQIQIDETKTFTGTPQIKLNVETNLKDSSALSYSGIITLNNATIKGLPQVSEITALTGNVDFQKNILKTNNLSFKTIDTLFTVSGNLTDFNNPLINAEISSENLDFAKIIPLIPREMMQKVPAEITGHSKIKLNIKGLLSELPSSEISCQANMQNVNITTPKLPLPITALSGQINYAKNLLLWKDVEGTYSNKKYKSTGKIFDFKIPNITASLSSDQLSFNADITTKNQTLEINEIRGKFLNSVFYVTGSIDQFNTAKANVSLKADSSINLKDLPDFPLNFTKEIKSMNLIGEVSLSSVITGTGMDWRLWDVDFKAKSPKINAFNYPIDDFRFDYHQKDGSIDLLESTAKIYDGAFKLQAKGTIKDKDIPLEMAAELNRLNLELLRKGQNLKLSNLQGMISLDLVLNGPLFDLSKIKGIGNITVSEGILWELGILKGIFGMLLIPEFQNIIFTDAHADLNIVDKKISTQNAELISENVILNGSGWIDFDQNIDFDVNPKFSEISILESNSLRKAPTNLIAQSIAIHVTGTLKEPKFRSDTSVKKVLQNTTNVITDGVKSILDEVF